MAHGVYVLYKSTLLVSYWLTVSGVCLLKVLIVRPSYQSQLPVGTRVCAYWSEKFTCLHPGRICHPPSDDSDDDDEDSDDEKLFSVDFDDGDAGKIPLDFIRMLPADFPLQRTLILCLLSATDLVQKYAFVHSIITSRHITCDPSNIVCHVKSARYFLLQRTES